MATTTMRGCERFIGGLSRVAVDWITHNFRGHYEHPNGLLNHKSNQYQTCDIVYNARVHSELSAIASPSSQSFRM